MALSGHMWTLRPVTSASLDLRSPRRANVASYPGTLGAPQMHFLDTNMTSVRETSEELVSRPAIKLVHAMTVPVSKLEML